MEQRYIFCDTSLRETSKDKANELTKLEKMEEKLGIKILLYITLYYKRCI